MVKEIRLYMEGGNGKDTKASLQQGMGQFLSDLNALARSRKIKWSITACGPRTFAYADFKTALKTHPDAFNVLLVDSEGPIVTAPWQHLKTFDKWAIPPGVEPEQCQLMVQFMETWLIADLDALRQFYGQGFRDKLIPKNPKVEQIDKDVLMSALTAATQNTQPGPYHKIHHARQLLAQVDVAKVRQAAAYCDRLFTTLAGKMDASI
jgi:hypothetical protein